VRLVEDFAQRWGEQAARAVPPDVRVHARASIREELLAMASVWEETLQRIEARARELRRGLEHAHRLAPRKGRRTRKQP
jgi:hypothetical protein